MIIALEFVALCIVLAQKLDGSELSIFYWVLTGIFALLSILALAFWIGSIPVIPLSAMPKALKISMAVLLAFGIVVLMVLTAAAINTTSSSNAASDYNPEKTANLRFYHNCKCGGTTIHKVSNNHWFDQNAAMHKTNQKFHFADFDPGVRALVSKHRPFHTYDKLPFDEHDPVFSVVRNPYDYIVSLYKYCCKEGKLVQSKQGLNMFVAFIPLMNSLMPRDLVFQSSLDSQFKKLHKRPGILVDHILHQENLANEFNTLMDQYGLEYKIQKDTKENKTNDNLSSKDLNFYSKFIIRELYRDDFKHFGYSM